jgi:hypothetical protein
LRGTALLAELEKNSDEKNKRRGAIVLITEIQEFRTTLVGWKS